ncbi:MAG TPA: 30S ribosomal protein S17e [Nitrososphaeraceae archaeon]|jgi:small subunit ribosomal protein S17e
MDRVRKISEELLNRYRDRFGTDIEQNKKVVTELAKVTSKQLRNRVAGFITSSLRKEAKAKESSEREVQKSQENVVLES